jgi:hypothetical protein
MGGGGTSSLPRSRSLSSSTPRYENVRNVRFFFRSAATWGSVTLASAWHRMQRSINISCCSHRDIKLSDTHHLEDVGKGDEALGEISVLGGV